MEIKTDNYVSPALHRLKASILNFQGLQPLIRVVTTTDTIQERIPADYLRQSKEYEEALQRWQEEDSPLSSPSNGNVDASNSVELSVQSLATLLLTVERHIATEALVDDWAQAKKPAWYIHFIFIFGILH